MLIRILLRQTCCLARDALQRLLLHIATYTSLILSIRLPFVIKVCVQRVLLHHVIQELLFIVHHRCSSRQSRRVHLLCFSIQFSFLWNILRVDVFKLRALALSSLLLILLISDRNVTLSWALVNSSITDILLTRTKLRGFRESKLRREIVLKPIRGGRVPARSIFEGKSSPRLSICFWWWLHFNSKLEGYKNQCKPNLKIYNYNIISKKSKNIIYPFWIS